MKAHASLMWLMLATFLLVLSACDAESKADSDGDLADGDGDGSASCALGATCQSQNDCCSGQECILGDNGFICSKLCTSDAVCIEALAGSVCKQVGASYYCIPSQSTADGDETQTDGDSVPEECTPDTYRCNGLSTVEHCKNDKTWETYRTCPGEMICQNGACVESSSECDPVQMGLTCCPNTYRCRGAFEVQVCDSEGSSWKFYNNCTGGLMCVDGECMDMTPDLDGDQATTDGDVEVVEQEEEEPQGDPCTKNEDCTEYAYYCFTPDGEAQGHCRLACTERGGRCPRGYQCNTETQACETDPLFCTDTTQCKTTEFCKIFPGASDGQCTRYCFELGEQCPTNHECIKLETDPNYGTCIPTMDGEYVSCAYDGECLSTQYCDIPQGITQGYCLDKCTSNDDCTGAMTCDGESGRCRPGNEVYECPGGCASPYICDTFYGVCVLPCPPCGDKECCDATSAPNCYTCECTNPIACGWGLRPCCAGYSCSAIVYGVLGFCI